jgi:membrane-associated phospholipid phosphatase
MVLLKYTCNLFSLIVVFANIYIIYKFNIIAILGNLLSFILHNAIKISTTNLKPLSIFKRPDGAENCGIFNTGGLVEHQSGFPSGHMTSISFIMTYLLIHSNKKCFTNLAIYNIPIILVGIGRYYKYCHNFIQIITGYILGSTLALFFYFRKKYILNIITQFNLSNVKF